MVIKILIKPRRVVLFCLFSSMARTKQTARRVIPPKVKLIYDRIAQEDAEKQKEKDAILISKEQARSSVEELETLKSSHV